MRSALLSLIFHPSIYLYEYLNGLTNVCLSVGMWRANGNPNFCMDLDKILHTHPHLSKEGCGASLTPALSPSCAWGA